VREAAATRPGHRRVGAAAGLVSVIVGGPAALLLLSGFPHLSTRFVHPREVVGFLSGHQISLDSVVHFLSLVLWGMWLYLVLAVLLRSAAWTVRRRGGGFDRVMRLSDALTPRVLRTFVDAALAVSLLAGGPRANATWGTVHPKAHAVLRAQPDACAEERHSGTYAVKRGDTLWDIADDLLGSGNRYRRIFQANEGHPMGGRERLQDPNVIQPGWRLDVPDRPRTYRVREGDTLWDIAERELGDGRCWRDLYAINRGRVFSDGEQLEDSDELSPGWGLTLPTDRAGRGRPPKPEHRPSPPPSKAPATIGPSPREPSTRPYRQPPHVVRPPTKSPEREPFLSLPDDVLIAASTAAGLLAAAIIAARRRRSRRMDFFASAPEVPHPVETFTSLLRQRLRGVEADRVAVAADRLARIAEQVGVPLVVLGSVESAAGVNFLMDARWDDLDRVGPHLAEALGCTVRARDLPGDRMAVTLEDLSVGTVSFLPASRPLLPLLVPIGVVGSSVLSLNLAAVEVALAGPEAPQVAVSVAVAAAAKASPAHLRLVPAGDVPGVAVLARLPHASGLDLPQEILRRKEQFRVEGVQDAEHLGAETMGRDLPSILAMGTTGESVDDPSVAIHALTIALEATTEGSVRAEEGRLVLPSSVGRVLGLGEGEIAVNPFRLSEDQVEACVELLREAFPVPPWDFAAGIPVPDAPPAPRMEEQPFDEKSAPTEDAPILRAAAPVAIETLESLALFCLGPFRASVDGRSLARGRTKVFELLARLALNHGQWVAKERIAEDLWPEMDPETQGDRLRKTASALRALLRSGEGDRREFVQRQRGAYRLNPEIAWTDVSEFEASVEAGRRTAGEEGLRSLRHAIELYRGDLVEDSYFEWAEPEARRLRDHYLGCLLLLAERLHERDDFDGALDAANRGLAVEPLSEAFFLRAMRAYVRVGRGDAAMALHREFEARLRAEGLDLSEHVVEEITALLRPSGSAGRHAG
jgi:DNA-binding SARP family transcriptional activator